VHHAIDFGSFDPQPLEGRPFEEGLWEADSLNPRSPRVCHPPSLPHSVPPSLLIGPKICIRWISNFLRLAVLADSDRRRRARGLSGRHDAEIDRLRRSDLSPGVGRYYHFPFDTDEHFEEQIQAEIRRFTGPPTAPQPATPIDLTWSDDTDIKAPVEAERRAVRPTSLAPLAPVRREEGLGVRGTERRAATSPHAAEPAAPLEPRIQALATATGLLAAKIESLNAATKAHRRATKQLCAATKAHRNPQRSRPGRLHASARRRTLPGSKARPTRMFSPTPPPAADAVIAASQAAVAELFNNSEIQSPRVPRPRRPVAFAPPSLRLSVPPSSSRRPPPYIGPLDTPSVARTNSNRVTRFVALAALIVMLVAVAARHFWPVPSNVEGSGTVRPPPSEAPGWRSTPPPATAPPPISGDKTSRLQPTILNRVAESRLPNSISFDSRIRSDS
jgi:hypothetical protein